MAGLKRSSRFKGGVMSWAFGNQLMNTVRIILEVSNGKTQPSTRLKKGIEILIVCDF